MVFKDKEYLLELTREWKGERFGDGRPRVSDDLIERIFKAESALRFAWKMIP